jgi:hypothetical protein
MDSRKDFVLTALASQVYALLYRVPGIGLAKENNLESYMVANVVFFMGLFTFAIFLGEWGHCPCAKTGGFFKMESPANLDVASILRASFVDCAQCCSKVVN